jgi:hypothetical protein
MSYVLDPNDGMYYWDEDGVGNINNIPKEAIGKIKASPKPSVDINKAAEKIFQDIASGAGAIPSASDFDVYWNTGESEYQGSQFVSGETARSFSSIEQEFKNLSIKDPEYLRWVDALRKTEFGSAFPKKKTPTKGQVLSALRKAGQEASITGTSLQDLVYNNAEYKSTTGGTSAEARANSIATIKARALNIGAELTDSQAAKLAVDYAQGGMSIEVLDANIAKVGKIDINKGQLATDKAELKAWALDNNVNYSEAWFDATVANIAKGVLTKDTAKAEITNQAKINNPAEYFVKGLDSGRSIRQLASPALLYLSRVRGVDESLIPLDDPLMKRYTNARDDKGNPTYLPNWQFETIVKNEDPAYPTSELAQNDFVPLLNSIGQFFGKSIGRGNISG